MRMNVKNAISYELVEESDIIQKIDNGFNLSTFKRWEDGYKRKTHLILDFGTFTRTVWFDTDHERDNFILDNFTGYNNCIITK